MAKKIIFMERFNERYGVVNAADAVANIPRDYAKQVTFVNAYVVSVTASKLPVLQEPPAHWDDYVKTLIKAKTVALEWINDISASLDEMPHDTIDSAKSLDLTFSSCMALCDILIKNPGRESAIRDLKADMDTSIVAINRLEGVLTQLSQKVSTFHGKVTPMANDLQKLADLAKKDSKADKAAIEKLNNDIERMRAEVKSCIAALVGYGFADAVAVTLGVVAVAVAGPLGLITWLFLGAVVGIATYEIVVTSQRMNQLKDSIQRQLGQVDRLTLDIAALDTVAKDMGDFAKQAEQVQGAIKAILDEWQAIRKELQDVRNHVDAAGKDFTKKDWQDAKREFTGAKKATEILKVHAQRLMIPKQEATTAKLEIGMDKNQVHAALAAGEKKDYYEWVRAM